MKINSPAATNFTVICTIGRKYLKIIRVIFYLATNSSIWRCWQTSYDVARLRLTWVQKNFGSKEILGPVTLIIIIFLLDILVYKVSDW